MKRKHKNLYVNVYSGIISHYQKLQTIQTSLNWEGEKNRGTCIQWNNGLWFRNTKGTKYGYMQHHGRISNYTKCPKADSKATEFHLHDILEKAKLERERPARHQWLLEIKGGGRI